MPVCQGKASWVTKNLFLHKLRLKRLMNTDSTVSNVFSLLVILNILKVFAGPDGVEILYDSDLGNIFGNEDPLRWLDSPCSSHLVCFHKIKRIFGLDLFTKQTVNNSSGLLIYS